MFRVRAIDEEYECLIQDIREFQCGFKPLEGAKHDRYWHPVIHVDDLSSSMGERDS